MSVLSDLEDRFEFQIRAFKLTTPEREYRFAAHAVGGPGKGLRTRLDEAGLKDWKMDFAWPDIKLAVEIEGGVWIGGRHNRGAGMIGDMRKYNAATLMGWKVLRFDGSAVKSGAAINMVRPLIRPITYSPEVI